MPILAAAERAHTSGRDFITALILGYEVYLRLSDAVKTRILMTRILRLSEVSAGFTGPCSAAVAL